MKGIAPETRTAKAGKSILALVSKPPFGLILFVEPERKFKIWLYIQSVIFFALLNLIAVKSPEMASMGF